jgi:CHAD domain-containing protein
VSPRAPRAAVFALEPGVDADALLEGLSALLPARRQAAQTGPALLLDTPDGRLAAAGALLSCGGEDHPGLALRRTGQPDLRSEATGCPQYAHELPEGPLREALLPLAAERRLLPVLELSGGVGGLDVLDDEGKTVARLRLADARVRRVGASDAEPLPALLTVEPVRGHPAEHAAVLAVLGSRLGVRATRTDPAGALRDAILAALPKPPPEPGADVTRRMRAGEALRRIHLAHLAVMHWNQAGLRAGSDTEYLHDWRVAVRRTRSVLGQIKDVFPKLEVQRFRTDLGSLARLTGPVRDLDVFILELEALVRDEPELAGLQPVIDELSERRREEQRRLVEGLDDPRAVATLHDWEAFLRRPVRKEDSGPAAARPLGELAARRVKKLHRRIAGASDALGDDAPAAELHALRIECKKMRYVLDAARRTFDPQAAEAVLGTLKRLQSVLGEAHDAHVQRGLLGSSTGHLTAADRAPPSVLMAVGRLAERLAAREDDARDACAERFDLLASSATTAQVRKLWKARAK